MWQGKPVSEWTLEEKNHFLTLLMGKKWDLEEKLIDDYLNDSHWYHYHPDYFTDSGFASVKRYMEKELPVVWNGFLNYCHIVPKDKQHLLLSDADILNAQLDLTNLITFLLDNQEWAWKECLTCNGSGHQFLDDYETDTKNCYGCNGTGKVKHPALLFMEGL